MDKRTQQAIEVLKNGGFFRRQLETQYRGGEKFVYRLRDANGSVVKGFGFQTFTKLQSQLIRKECSSGSTWPSEWKLLEAVAA